MTPKRQKQVLAVLGVLLMVFIARAVIKVSSSGSPRGKRRAALSRPLPRAGGSGTVAGPEIVELKMSDLERKPSEFQPGRDPFRFQPKARPKPPPPPPPKPRPQPQPQRAPAPQQPAAPQPPEPTFVFLGSFGPEDRRIAVFSDSAEIFNVIEGDVFKEAFVVRKIGYESADVGWVNFPEEPARRLVAGG